MNNKPISSLSRPNVFKITENEIYMIKENNIRRIHEIIKNTSNARPNEGCSIVIDEDLDANNRNIIESIGDTREIFDKIFEVKRTKRFYKTKLEKKYQECQAHINKTIRIEELQKAVNASLNLLRKEAK